MTSTERTAICVGYVVFWALCLALAAVVLS